MAYTSHGAAAFQVVEHQRARLVQTLAASQHLVVEVECSPDAAGASQGAAAGGDPGGRVRRCCASIRNGRTTLIANKLGCSHMTVADVRTELETTSQIGQLDRHLGEDLKWRKVKRKTADWPHKALQDPEGPSRCCGRHRPGDARSRGRPAGNAGVQREQKKIGPRSDLGAQLSLVAGACVQFDLLFRAAA